MVNPISYNAADRARLLLLQYLAMQEHEAHFLNWTDVVKPLIEQGVFTNKQQALFYIEALKAQGLLRSQYEQDQSGGQGLSYDGLLAAGKAAESGRESTLCFVAMSFAAEDAVLFDEGIAPACAATGFTATRVDREAYGSDITINDAILAGIKRSRFCIADFTKHRNGVYFEAGYALGRGMEVIYTCHQDSFQDAHFDTNRYPHLLYSSPSELRTLLIDKIEVAIKL